MSIKIKHKKRKIGLLTPCVIERTYKTVNIVMLFKDLNYKRKWIEKQCYMFPLPYYEFIFFSFSNLRWRLKHWIINVLWYFSNFSLYYIVKQVKKKSNKKNIRHVKVVKVSFKLTWMNFPSFGYLTLWLASISTVNKQIY